MGESLRERFAQNAELAGFHVHSDLIPELDGAEVSLASYALADSGSVVIASSPEEPRARSLLSRVHVTVVREDVILPSLADLFRAVGGDLPSSLAIVTGPSRSADIEMRLAVGMHGPAEVHVALLSQPAVPVLSGSAGSRDDVEGKQ